MNQELKTLIDDIVASKDGINTEEGRKKTDALMDDMLSLPLTPDEKHDAARYLTESMSSHRKRSDVPVKKIIEDCTDAINLSYIAKRYFHKDRSWLSQRLNGSIVNGKAAAFTESELKTLSESLADIGAVISKTSLLIQNTL